VNKDNTITRREKKRKRRKLGPSQTKKIESWRKASITLHTPPTSKDGEIGEEN